MRFLAPPHAVATRPGDAKTELPADAAALLPDGLVGLPPHLATSLPAALRDAVLGRYSNGFNTMFVWVAVLYFVAMALTLLGNLGKLKLGREQLAC